MTIRQEFQKRTASVASRKFILNSAECPIRKLSAHRGFSSGVMRICICAQLFLRRNTSQDFSQRLDGAVVAHGIIHCRTGPF